MSSCDAAAGCTGLTWSERGQQRLVWEVIGVDVEEFALCLHGHQAGLALFYRTLSAASQGAISRGCPPPGK